MRAGKIMTALNWRHAFGELTLIVLGILIALGISDWNDRRIERIQETALLNEVRTALESDLSELERRLALVRETEPKLEQLSRQLKSGAAYEPSMDALFGAAYGVHSINLNTTVYETLKSVGLQSVSNNRLRLGITRIFDHFYERVLSERDIDIVATLGVMRPYYLERVMGIEPT